MLPKRLEVIKLDLFDSQTATPISAFTVRIRLHTAFGVKIFEGVQERTPPNVRLHGHFKAFVSNLSPLLVLAIETVSTGADLNSRYISDRSNRLALPIRSLFAGFF